MLVAQCIKQAYVPLRKADVVDELDLYRRRRLYEGVGISAVRDEAHFSFGRELVGEYRRLDL